MSKTQLSILVNLARADGNISEKESALIRQIGIAHGMSLQEITAVIQAPENTHNLSSLTPDDKFEYMYNIVQLMKVDGRLSENEIKFCTKMASRLGYDEAVLFELVTKIYTDPKASGDRQALKDKVQKYLRT